MGSKALWGARALGLWVALGCALFATSARASVIEALDLEALTLNSDQVVVARVVAQQSHYDEHRRIVTDVELVVESSEKGGAAKGSTVIVRRLGGVVNGVGMRVEGEPSFVSGERTLIFAKALLQDTKVLRPVGMSQGVLRIEEREGQSWVSSAAGGAALVRRAADGSLAKARVAVEQPRKLVDVLSEIRALVAKANR